MTRPGPNIASEKSSESLGICLQVVSLGVITVSRASIENQHLLDLLPICEIVAGSSYNCGQI